MSWVPPRPWARRPAYTAGMQAMVSGVLVVAAFAVVAAAAGFVAARLYRVSRWAPPGAPGGEGRAGEQPDA
jgi:hypothetical protein